MRGLSWDPRPPPRRMKTDASRALGPQGCLAAAKSEMQRLKKQFVPRSSPNSHLAGLSDPRVQGPSEAGHAPLQTAPKWKVPTRREMAIKILQWMEH